MPIIEEVNMSREVIIFHHHATHASSSCKVEVRVMMMSPAYPQVVMSIIGARCASLCINHGSRGCSSRLAISIYSTLASSLELRLKVMIQKAVIWMMASLRSRRFT